MMMHKMSPLMCSYDSDDDASQTPPSPSKPMKKKQHSSPENDHVSDGKKSSTEQKDGQKKTYSYMSPVSSDADDVPEMPQRTGHAKQPKRKSGKSSQRDNPEQRLSIKRCSWKTEARHQQISSNGSTDSISEMFSNQFIANAPASRKAKEKCGISTETIEKLEQIISDLNKAKECRTKPKRPNAQDAKDSVAHKATKSSEKFKRIKCQHSESAFSDIDEKPKMQRAKEELTRKNKYFKMSLGKPDLAEQPAEGSSCKPRVKTKVGPSPRRAVPIKCEICDRSMHNKVKLKRHMLSHTGEKPFECDKCGKQYTSSSNLRIHRLSHSGKMDYVCNTCGQKFTHLPYLKRHLLRHSGMKMHNCEHCGKGFFQKYHLLRHIMVHTRQASQVCEKCGMGFNCTDSLNLHLRNVHLVESNTPKAKAENLYRCEDCNKLFASHSSLEKHMRIHTSAMPYSCTVCSQQFKQSSHLYSHMITHSSEKPYACSLCELRYTRKRYLRKHKEKVHGGAGDAQNV